jgi:hypothetical protein
MVLTNVTPSVNRLPQITVDGPLDLSFGGLLKYETVPLVGAGIGVYTFCVMSVVYCILFCQVQDCSGNKDLLSLTSDSSHS